MENEVIPIEIYNKREKTSEFIVIDFDEIFRVFDFQPTEIIDD